MWKNIEKFNLRINLQNTRSGNYYTPSRPRLTLTQRQSIMYQAPINWEKIPLAVKNSNSLKKFKKQYKKFFMSSYNSN